MKRVALGGGGPGALVAAFLLGTGFGVLVLGLLPYRDNNR